MQDAGLRVVVAAGGQSGIERGHLHLQSQDGRGALGGPVLAPCRGLRALAGCRGALGGVGGTGGCRCPALVGGFCRGSCGLCAGCGLRSAGRCCGFAGLGSCGAGLGGLSRLQELFGHLDGRLVAGGGQDDRPLELFQQLLAFGRGPVEACLDDFGIEAGPGHQVDLLFKRHVASDGQFPARGQGSAFVEVGHAAAVVVQAGGPAAGRAAVAVGAGQGDGQLFRPPDFEGKRKIRGRTVAFEQGTAGTVRHGHANSRKRGGQGRPPYSEERVSGRQRACNQLSGRGRGRRSLASDCRAWGRLAL